MAQVEPSTLSVTIGPSSSSDPALDQVRNGAATLRTEETTQADTAHYQQLYQSRDTGIGTEVSVGDDDDVQFVFAVPRRKKKKRKRYDL